MLGRCMNATLRFVTGISKFDQITPTYEKLQILPFMLRREYICLCLLASILATKEPRPIFVKFCFREPDSAGSRRRPDLELIYETPRTDYIECSFAVGAARLWNAIPASLRTLYQRPCFKGHLFRYLLQAAHRQKSLLV